MWNAGSCWRKVEGDPSRAAKPHVQADAPPAAQRDNWLPAPKGSDFTLFGRACWPKASVMDGTWTPPPVQKVS